MTNQGQAVRTYADNNRITISDDQCDGMAAAVVTGIINDPDRNSDRTIPGGKAAVDYAAVEGISCTADQYTEIVRAVISA